MGLNVLTVLPKFFCVSLAFFCLFSVSSYCIAQDSQTKDTFSQHRHTMDVELKFAEVAGMSMEQEIHKGMGRELLETALTNIGLTYSVEFLPWSRLMKSVSDNPKALMLPLGRTEQRENRFQWVEPIFTAHFGFVSRQRPINTLQEASQQTYIGVWKNTLFESYLRQKGLNNLVPFRGDEKLGLLFEGGRITSWFGELNETRYRLKQFNLHRKQPISPIYFGAPVNEIQAWLIAGKEFPDKQLKAIRDELHRLNQSGFADQLFNKYYRLDPIK